MGYDVNAMWKKTTLRESIAAGVWLSLARFRSQKQRVLRIQSRASFVIVLRGAEVLLIRRPFGSVWELPGGALKYHESYEDAAVRELREETNLGTSTVKSSDLASLGRYIRNGNEQIAVFVANAQRDCTLSKKYWSLEVAETRFFSLTMLPALMPGAYRRIQECVEQPTSYSRQVGLKPW